MASTTPDEVSVSQQLVAGGLRLVESDAAANLSVRRLAEAAQRSTMCVYTYFGGRQKLLAAMHDDGARRLLDSLRSAAPAERAAALRAWAEAHPSLTLWLLTSAENDEIRAQATALQAAVLELLEPAGGSNGDGHGILAATVGRLVLEGNR